jgi:hypothetical protein
LSGKAKVIDIDVQKLNKDFITAAKNALVKCQYEKIHFAILTPTFININR